ncbi:hypothetical protein [Ghiorsea bivora]|uniref:hypothetical protein n=1 Tax=Ghiorsea bivora TaxID=1485545 RepID=UPI00056F229F|nr:hypothetical protein [Ghiorsea bivora]
MKKVLGLGLMLVLGNTSALAQPQYVGSLNAGLGNGAAVSCSACHSGSPSGGNAVLPMAATWRSGASLALSDSDGDGYNNAQEVNGGSTNFNYNTMSPFTLAKTAEGSASTTVVVVGGGQVTETAITDIYTQAGITLAAGHSIAGGVSPLINTAVTPTPTIYFNRAVNAGDKVYMVDFTNSTATLMNTATFNADGSVTVSGLPNAASVNIVVDRATPIVPRAGSPRGGEDEEGCVSGSLSTPLLMTFGLLVMGLLLRRKQA